MFGKLIPSKLLTEKEVDTGLRYSIYDGLATETMTAFTGGAFLVSVALLSGASNFQVGLLAALPTFTNIFQLISIWLVRKYNNRRAISVICSLLARFPLIIIGIILLFVSGYSFTLFLSFIFFFYLFGSIAGPSWNSWMKDLVPEKILGSYFSKRSSYTQTLNVVVSLALALLMDFTKSNYPEYELTIYGCMFVAGGIAGVIGTLFLSRVPEPQSILSRENLFRLFRKPLQNANFRRLLIFNSIWVLAVNFATPFFTVFLINSMKFSLLYIIGLNILSQLSSILTIRLWGYYADRYSNKTIIAIGWPLYLLCIIGWCFVGIYTRFYANLSLLAGIYIIMGISTAGINLSLTNIGLKLAPREEAIVYLSVKNIVTSLFASLSPLAGGYLADYFIERKLSVNATWSGPAIDKTFRLLDLHEWNFLFAIAAVLIFIALEFLVAVKEVGEVEKDLVVKAFRIRLKNNLKDAFVIGNLIEWHEQLWRFLRKRPFNGKVHIKIEKKETKKT